MAAHKAKSVETLDIDYANHTLEVDIRWMLANDPKLNGSDGTEHEAGIEPTVVLDLDDAQVDSILSKPKSR